MDSLATGGISPVAALARGHTRAQAHCGSPALPAAAPGLLMLLTHSAGRDTSKIPSGAFPNKSAGCAILFGHLLIHCHLM